jgi:hypothetical protein
MNLIDHWVVGFSGKRQLNNSEALGRVVRDVLHDLRDIVQGKLVAISSAAIGGDMLFAHEATQMGMPWICVLPFPIPDFFNEQDFPNEVERNAARRRVDQAADAEVVRVADDEDELNDPIWRRAAFAEAGFRCVDEADIMIAVVREGAEPGKPGGTRDIVAYARAAKRPLVMIDPDTAEVRRENWAGVLQDPLTERLRRLPLGRLSENDRAKLPTPVAVQLGEWRSAFAQAARKHVPGIRWATSFVVILHALATLFTASIFLLLPALSVNETAGSVLEIAAFLIVLSGFIFLIWLIWNRPERNAANFRLAAEVGRSVLATWSIPAATPEILRSVPGEFAHFARNLLLHQRFDPNRRRALDHVPPDEINQLATEYLTGRIKPQVTYYLEKCAKASRVAHRIEISSILLSLAAVICAALLAFGHKFGIGDTHKASWGFAKLAAATAAPVMVSLLVIHEIKRREARYDEMRSSLQRFGERLAHVRSLTALRDLIVDVERMLLDECYDWWVLAKANVAA